MNTDLQKGRKSTQRERLVAGMIAVATRDGYAGASVAAVIAEAGVSRPTFYDYFADRDDCFVATLTDVTERLLINVERAVGGEAPEHATRAAVEALVDFAGSQPAMARFLMGTSMTGGRRALEARDRGVARIEQIIEEAHARVPRATAIPDLSPRLLVGGVYRLLASRLRRGAPGLAGLAEGLVGWTKTYERPSGEHRWRALQPHSALATSPAVGALELRAPAPLPPGRTRLPKDEVAEQHRLRIMLATTQVAQEKGYSATTIADLTKLAGVDGRVFYSLFADKEDAFMAAQELGVERLMLATARAFFAGSSWPERLWQAASVFSQFLDDNPAVAYAGFVEAYAVGPGSVQRVEDGHTAYTIFLQEGYQHDPSVPGPPPVAPEAITKTLFEGVYRQARDSSERPMSGLLPHSIFLCLAPFLGPIEADRFIDQQL